MARSAKFPLAWQLLIGSALAKFNNTASLQTTETREHYLQCTHTVILGVFPQDSLKEQKQWTRHFLKKLANMNIGNCMSRVVEINNFLLQFPPCVPGANSKKLPTNKLLELLEFGILLTWRNQMHLQNFQIQQLTIKAFTKMCERLESAFSDSPSNKHTNKGPSNKNESQKRENSVATTTRTKMDR